MNYVIVYYSGKQVVPLTAGFTAESIAALYGITDPALWAEFADTDFDAVCFSFPSSFSIVNNLPSPNTVTFSLSEAKVIASTQVKTTTASEQATVLAGYTSEVLAAQATLPELSRTPEIQASIVAVNDLNTALQSELAAIAAATDINEVNNVVNKPTGILFTGRGSGLGPEDLNVSYYTAFNSASMAPSETELYVPGTSTVIPYGSGGAGQFDSAGDCFAPGDYILQIREVATGMIIAEFECPLAPAGVDVAF